MEERSNVYEMILERLTAMLGPKDYNEDTKYADIGMKSVNYSSMITALEDEFDVEIPDEEIERIRTVGELVAYIEGHQ